jgi:BRCA1-associated protein
MNSRRDGLDTLLPASLITPNDTIVAEKVESMGVEYAGILHSQLSNQRKWYETRISKMDQTSTDYICTLLSENEVVKKKCVYIERSLWKVQKDNEAQTNKLATFQTKIDKLQTKIQNSENELTEERSLNQGLITNQKYLNEVINAKDLSLKEMDATLTDYQDQIRDLMFFLETKSKVEKGDLELKDASILGVSTKPETPTSSNKKNKSRKK